MESSARQKRKIYSLIPPGYSPFMAKTPTQSRLSAVVAAENEDDVIARCLKSLAFCDEIVLVDGGSTDRTVEIAQSLGARVIAHDSGVLGIHHNKNLGAESADGDWILSIDADEEVGTDLAREIRSAVAEGSCDSYRIPRRTYFLGQWIRHSGWWPGYVIRLFRKGHTEWPLEVHDVPKANGPSGTLTHPIEHYSYDSLSDWVRKADHFSGCEAEEAIRRGEAPRGAGLFLGLTLYPVAIFLNKIVRASAWKDGMPGIVIAGSAAFASWLRAAKAWEVKATGRRHDLGGREKLGR